MLKQYTSMREIARDMRTIKRITRPLANIKAVTAALSDKDNINIRGKGVDRSQFNETKNPISSKSGAILNKKTAELDKLLEHQLAVNNILNTLQNEFTDGDYPEKDKLITVAKRLVANLAEKVNTLKASLTSDAKKTLPKLLEQVSYILKRKLDKELLEISEKASSTAMTGMVKAAPQHTIYYIYNNVSDDKGEIAPQVVFALSSYEDKLYINPALHTIVVPGKFNLGFELGVKGTSPADYANAALKEINTQLLADSMLSGVAGNPVPLTQKKLNGLKAGNGVKMSFNKDADALLVSVSTKMTDVAVQELANKITIQLTTIIRADKTLPKMVVRYTKKKKTAPAVGWTLTYKFIPAGKYTGKTLNQEDVDHLRKRFTDEEIHQMLIALQK